MTLSTELFPTLLLVTMTTSQITDVSLNPRTFETNTLPKDRFMASVGNGHVATVVMSDTIFMNGLYNGERGDSHRARIPSRINIRVKAPPSPVAARFVLNTEEGTFLENIFIGDVAIEQITYAHRLHTPLMVVQIKADFSASALKSINFNLTDNPGADSSDITFSPAQNFMNGPGKYQKGKTIVVEEPKYQPDRTSVHVIYSDVPETLTLTTEHPTATFLMSMASSFEEASNAYLYGIDLVQRGASHEILQAHISQWAAIWKAGNVYLEGPNLELAKVVAGSLYYLLSSLPSQEDNTKRKRFYGLSPGSLAHGTASRDYQGHSFWDSETWMFPPVLLLWPHIAKDLLLYRMANVAPARDRAKADGYQGIRFPWESGFTGAEVTPDCCPETRDRQQHITADISFASRQYVAVTGDEAWLVGENYGYPLELNGCDFIYGMAEFWASRAEFNAETGRYDINDIMPPDEDHDHVNNSIYTNVGAAYSIFFAKHVECLCNGSMASVVPEAWLNIARKLAVPSDERNPYHHPEFEGYVIGDTIKQADVVLLGYPVMFVTDPVVRKNDLDLYEDVIRSNGPAMTWGMHSIGHLELNEDERGEAMLNRSYKPYKIEPFKVWSETQNETGALNFITGMGGFLQALIFGYGGVRIHLDRLEFHPKLPRGITNFTIQGINYLDCSFNIYITTREVRVDWIGDSCRRLKVTTNANEANQKPMTHVPYESCGTVVFDRKPFNIRPKDAQKTCPLPEDDVGRSGVAAIASSSTVLGLLMGFTVIFRSPCHSRNSFW